MNISSHCLNHLKWILSRLTILSCSDELLLCCSRTAVDPEIASRIRILLQQDIDWSYVVQTALKHNVIPLLFRTLKATDPENVPRCIHDQLRHFYFCNAARNLFLTNELIKLLKVFQSHDIPIIPYKGPVLAASVYEDIAYRTFSDLDVLVHKLDFHLRVHKLFISKGWQLSKNFAWEKTFRGASGRVGVDVHKSVTHRQMPFKQNFERLWQRYEMVSLLGKMVITFSPADLLIILCVQMAKDASANRICLAKICDISELIRKHQDLDWGLVTEEASKLGVLHILYLGLMTTRYLLGTIIPIEVLQKAQAVPKVATHVTHVTQCILGGVESVYSHPELLNRSHFHSEIRERLRDRFDPKYLYYITPNEYDFKFLPLPKNYFPLYYLVRPIRLICKYIRKIGSAKHVVVI